MTTRHQSRTAAFVTMLTAALAIGGVPAPASAAAPRVAQSWSSLMYHSLTPTAKYVALRERLAAQRATLASRAAQVTRGRATHSAAQTALATAVTVDAAARTRSAIAAEAVTSAKNRLTVVSQRRPVSGVAVTASKKAVTSSSATLTAARAQARETAAALRTAQADAWTATVTLDTSTVAWQRLSEAVSTNQQRLRSLDTSAELARRAAALSDDVVAQVRASFRVADTTSVSGITVHKNVAFAFRRMLADARADGVELSGGGFRTRQRQIELRRSNGCPDVYTAPPSSCRVPTAIPGRSLHELGLAVDITAGGRSLTSDSAGFRWLSAHAARYGYVNLPSEPWHWSITGG